MAGQGKRPRKSGTKKSGSAGALSGRVALFVGAVLVAGVALYWGSSSSSESSSSTSASPSAQSSSATLDASCCLPPPSSSPSKVRVAITTTVKAPSRFFEWLCYHYKIGFDHVYVFLDDPNDAITEITDLFGERLTIIRNTPQLLKEQRNQTSFVANGPFVTVEVMARQNLNAEYAAGLAAGHNVQWLLHIDDDELFYTGEETIRDHFEQLERRKFTQAVYLNYESLPTMENAANPFTDIRMFKRNRISVAEEPIQKWTRERGPYTMGYWTGKSAVRITPGMYPLEVTRWRVPNELRANFDGPLILHYINPSVDRLIAKYKRLGRFADKTFDKELATEEVRKLPDRAMAKESTALLSHRQLRDLVMDSPESFVRQRFKSFGMLAPDEVANWLPSNLLVYIPKPAALINSLMQCAEHAPTPHKKLKRILPKEARPPSYVPAGLTSSAESNCFEFTNSDRVTCFAPYPCCHMLSRSKGALKVSQVTPEE